MNADDKRLADCAAEMAEYLAEKTGYTVADTLGPAVAILASNRPLRETEVTAEVYDANSLPPVGVTS